ncbi:glycerate kinase [Parabacteroides sp. PF5-5]|uniref:glycerate kinase family protein n=1 Tax=unclassified Parabacteroides TaxID=2649774 RepID=UPI0024738BD3|nr:MULTISPECIES: glycerate kinase [unclassified Parabacteroides]MDH6306539.1 glycerate kinase [Parabacteroides sp. PH5-39]MDH6317506.1 glycerate kinase [Parabacteroides sp. PF5-13]MDH6321191.1 glycerate kinase [Parabacteroides sp. PH5-13]MDH6324923.1 glycerate kinase [Parabacteroides sp. PH5-8]MDH6328632.1 glycerate kinase [Parabacteroides sp. PH5-41]
MKKIVVASDSFKGSVSSLEVADSVEKAIHKVFPECEVLKIPVADGGEGTTESLVYAMNGKMISCEVHDPLMNKIQVQYGILGDMQTAVIEMASASGLPLVPKEKRNPMKTTTYGIGELIKDALTRGCRHFLIGIGGSATNDAGTGMLQALGFRFLDKEGRELGQGGEILQAIHTIDCSQAMPQLKDASFTIACDVNNPFSGENGAAYIYARQKGADDEMIRILDEGLSHFADVIKKEMQQDINAIPGAGAAGGLGGGFLAFLPAILKPGIQMVLEALHFAERIKGADLVITGEGKLDAQTAMGKTPSGVLQVAQAQGIPVIAIGGSVEEAESLNKQGFLAVFSILSGIATLQQAMDKAFSMRNIERIIEQFLRIILYYNESDIKKDRGGY